MRLHHSITPSLHHFITPSLHHSTPGYISYAPYSRDCATLHRLPDVCRPYRAHSLGDSVTW
ncbi:MAG: hypothetical protein E7068_01810 [Lentimicrobiaceae bacterium]|nr:hypothetical protein [Lentimicrobiaceae bacterium]